MQSIHKKQQTSWNIIAFLSKNFPIFINLALIITIENQH